MMALRLWTGIAALTVLAAILWQMGALDRAKREAAESRVEHKSEAQELTDDIDQLDDVALRRALADRVLQGAGDID